MMIMKKVPLSLSHSAYAICEEEYTEVVEVVPVVFNSKRSILLKHTRIEGTDCILR